MSDVIVRAVVFSCIAFSIVFIVLGGLTLVIYAMRMLTGGGEKTAGSAAPKEAAKPALSTPAFAPAANVKAQHVAAITAAILTMTQGRGRIMSISPVGGSSLWNTTQRWRAMAIVEANARTLAPSWKR
ncbi:MAG: OadG family protein [Synergistaceae bacterium]|jgi:Na+-transporting methylmalonyl-CoA/oxaloacetate decarboxylase gamma subunit|nr:OadG family protein [Synergistaceae bacterium]